MKAATMKRGVLLGVVVGAGLAISSPGHAATLRVLCDGANVGAEVTVNGEFKGECPIDMELPAGLVQVKVTKKIDDLHEAVFSQEVRLAEDTTKRLEVVLSPPQLTAEGQKIEDARIAAEQAATAAAAQQSADATAALLADLKAKGVEPGNGKSFRDCPQCPELVLIPAGRFGPQGGTNAGLEKVTFASVFAVGKFEVTHDEWAACVAEGACATMEEGKSYGLWVKPWGRGRQPASAVTRASAAKYLAWLSRKTGHTYRLPTYTEFAYVAFAGGRELPGLNVKNGANCGDCGAKSDGDRAMVVGSFAPNAWGLYDVTGNVEEKISDCYPKDIFQKVPADGGPVTTDCLTETQPATVGGSFNSPMRALGGDAFGAWFMHASTDIEDHSAYTWLDVGLRVVREVGKGY